jgi:hypothetical protein
VDENNFLFMLESVKIFSEKKFPDFSRPSENFLGFSEEQPKLFLDF